MKQVTPSQNQAGGGSLSPKDVYYIIFRHKWKITLLTLLGLVAGAGTYLLWPDSYVSQAQILIKYVTENREIVSEDGSSRTLSLGGRGNEYVMQTELAILNSMDLAKQIAQHADSIQASLPVNSEPVEAITPKVIKKGLRADAGRGSNIVSLTFTHPNSAFANAVLGQAIETYLERHYHIHQDRGAFDDFVIQETDQAKARLMQVEEELIAARRAAGVISVDQARTNLITEIARIRQTVNTTKTEIAENEAILQQLARQFDSVLETQQDNQQPEPAVALPEEEMAVAISDYERKRTQLDILRSREKQLLTRFTPESNRYKATVAQIRATEADLRGLIEKYPTLFSSEDLEEGDIASINPEEAAQRARLQQTKITSLQSRLEQLNIQMNELQQEATRLDQIELTLKDITRRKDLAESNYRVLLANMEKIRLKDSDISGRVSNITVIQSPTSAGIAQSLKAKIAGGVGGGLIALGFAWAFLVEMLFDQSIKRPSEVHKFLGIPLFLTLPDTNSKAFRKLTGKSSPERMRAIGMSKAKQAQKKLEYKPKSGTLQAAAKAQPETYGVANGNDDHAIAPWDDTHALHNYFEALRDKVVGYFESRNLTHNPKLIGMTGLGREPGVSTIASGLASSLSKTEGGNVLLVDMTLGKESAQQFYKGKAVGDIEEALESRTNGGQLSDKLFVVAEGSNGYKLPSILPRRFNSIIPKLKASDFDYIIFDMPAVSPISSTPRLASFMDITLMVMESEEVSRDVAKQATELLAESNVHLGAILNKTKSYVPNQLEQDFVGLS